MVKTVYEILSDILEVVKNDSIVIMLSESTYIFSQSPWF